MIIAIDNGEDYYLSESRCRSRVCPRCSKMRARTLSARIAGIIHRMDDPRFLTLTIRSNDQPLAHQIKHLRRRFGAMRRTSSWRKNVAGGVYTIEVTWNHEAAQWHPHLHCIIDGVYWPQAEILELWQSAVKDTAGADIRAVHGIRKLANYLACYVSKSCDLSELDGPRLAEWAIETHGLRLAQTFGSLQLCKPAQEDAEPLPTRMVELNVDNLAYQASAGVEAAELLLRSLEPRHRNSNPNLRHKRAGFLYAWQHAITARPPPAKRPIDRQLTLNG